MSDLIRPSVREVAQLVSVSIHCRKPHSAPSVYAVWNFAAEFSSGKSGQMALVVSMLESWKLLFMESSRTLQSMR